MDVSPRFVVVLNIVAVVVLVIGLSDYLNWFWNPKPAVSKCQGAWELFSEECKQVSSIQMLVIRHAGDWICVTWSYLLSPLSWFWLLCFWSRPNGDPRPGDTEQQGGQIKINIELSALSTWTGLKASSCAFFPAKPMSGWTAFPHQIPSTQPLGLNTWNTLSSPSSVEMSLNVVVCISIHLLAARNV